MSKLQKLQASTDIYGIAALLGFRPAMLAYLLYVIDPKAKYTLFEIPKRSGGARTIAAPIHQLKLLQHRLSALLQDCTDEISATKSQPDRASHGFTRKRSIFTNAKVHRRRRWVFNVDIENFFGSINFGRVRGYFIKNNDFALQPAGATVIAQIACHNNSLPQGSPCSPVLSNLIGHILDMRLIKVASLHGCSYSRYADDLSFSTNKREFPSSIAQPTHDPHTWIPGDALAKVLSEPFDEKIHFGKHVFAQKVVTPNASTINFEGFIPLLSNISAVITAHQASAPVL